MRWLIGAGAAVIVFFPVVAGAEPAPRCDQAAFSAVVTEAGSRLSAMNEANKKSFQSKLQSLRAREGWTDGDYLAKATPFVRDEQITLFDDRNGALLAKVPQLGGAAPVTATLASVSAGGAADSRNCQMLGELRGLMAQVVENTAAKWAYMLGKIDSAAASSPRQAQAGR